MLAGTLRTLSCMLLSGVRPKLPGELHPEELPGLLLVASVVRRKTGTAHEGDTPPERLRRTYPGYRRNERRGCVPSARTRGAVPVFR